MQSFFTENSVIEGVQANDFGARFQLTLLKLPNVGGTAGDYRVISSTSTEFPHSTVIEFKNDKRSVRTKNLYLEFRQTRDCFFTFKRSGIALAIKQGQIVVIKSGIENFIIRTLAEYKKLLEKSHMSAKTRAEINGNSNGCFTEGHLVKLIFARNILDSYP